ncbi:MAG: BrnT family toxin [Deltaproteobacteria bacterium]|nr:BrnT family toxin [Deltaproteobacteria bacterium]
MRYNHFVSVTVVSGKFEWHQEKEQQNFRNHNCDFQTAIRVFADPNRVVAHDEKHSIAEPRFFCFGMVDGKILTVRFTQRKDRIRIIGAAYWRKGRDIYAKKNKK